MRSYVTRLIWLCMTPLLAVGGYLAIDNVNKVQAERVTRADRLAHDVIGAVNDDLEDRIAALRLCWRPPPLSMTPGVRTSFTPRPCAIAKSSVAK
jgi:hypothetical protein